MPAERDLAGQTTFFSIRFRRLQELDGQGCALVLLTLSIAAVRLSGASSFGNKE